MKRAHMKNHDFGFLALADWFLTFALTAAVAVAIVSGAGAIGSF